MDRVPVDPRGGPEVISVEVYVSVGDERRGAVWSGWRHLGLATVVVAMIAVAVVSSLSSGGVHSRSASSARPFAVTDTGSPPSGARYRLLLVSHPYLPRDAKRLMHHDRCAASRRAALERAIETLYARAVADAQGEVLPGRAKLQATQYPMC